MLMGNNNNVLDAKPIYIEDIQKKVTERLQSVDYCYP